jgi:hypothetical protein
MYTSFRSAEPSALTVSVTCRQYKGSTWQYKSVHQGAMFE